jgi:hypothetical protein
MSVESIENIRSPFPKYPEIPLVVRRQDIFQVRTVICTEKLHGSTFRVQFPMGMTSIEQVRYGSAEMEYVSGQSFPIMHAVNWFKGRPELLTAMWEVIKSYDFPDATVFGEACGPGAPVKGKLVKYSTGQEILFRAFDIMVGTNFLNSYDLFVEVTDKMGLPRVPLIYRGEPSPEVFDGLLEKPSVEAQRNGIDDPANVAEGFVAFAEPRFRDAFGDWVMMKHKARKFAEVTPPAEKKVRQATPVDEFVVTYVTEGRLTNALGRLQSRGVDLTSTMKDMPTLLTEMVADLHKECEPEWQTLGAKEDQLPSAVSRVLGPMYRRLLEEQHAEQPNA